MADAEIISLSEPLGTKGRPGRGSKNATPSQAARSLAPARASPKRSPKAERPDAPPVTHIGRATPTQVPRHTSTDDAAGASTTDAEQSATAAGGDRVAAALAFLRRRLTGDYEIDDLGFDRELTSAVFISLLRPLAQRWFRIEVRGVENIPAEGGALLVANHSGTVPLDALMTTVVVHDHAGRYLRSLGADLLFALPLVSELARKAGSTLACSEDAERMLQSGELVGVWPEGFKGVGKPFSQRYKLQRFGRGGFVSAAIRTGVPIVPCSIVGAEETYPLVGNVPALARLLGVPYLPITPFFPWFGLLGLVPLPSKWVIEFGEPIRTDTYAESGADDPMLVFNLTDQVRETIQQTLYDLLMHRQHIFV